MSSVLFRLGRFSFLHKWWVLGTWVVIAAIVGGLVYALSPQFDKSFDLPGTDAGIAMEQMQEKFPHLAEQQTKARTVVVVAADDGLAAHSGQIDKLAAGLRNLDEVSEADAIVNPVTLAAADPSAGAQVLSRDGTIGLITVSQDIDMMEVEGEHKQALLKVLEQNRTGGLDVEATGTLMQAQEESAAEAIGFGVAFLVMIVAFGALIAAFIPLISGIVAVGLTMGLLTLSAEFMSVNQAATGIVMMLGIAVSIDYALFIVSRYRTERNRGGDPADAAGRAVGTAGTAVVFAGLMVVVAVAALMVIGIPIITQMGLGAAVAIVAAVLSSLTLIPAILGAFGRFAFTPRIPWIKHAEADESYESLGVKFGKAVVARPLPFIAVGLAILVAAAIPAKGMQLGMDMTSDEEVAAQEIIAKGFGEGVNGQLLVVLTADQESEVGPAATAAVDKIKTLPGVAVPEALGWMGNGTGEPLMQTGADAALIMVTPLSSPASPETHDLVEAIRALSPGITESGGITMNVGGETATLSDLSAKLDDALIGYIAVVVGLAFLIMIVVFRSIWVPLIGTLGFVFSLMAAFGVTTAVFTDGWLGLIENPKPMISILPIFLVGVVFGLAMDYQVFLVTRMREEFMHGMSPKDAIVAGYRHGARVVTSAAVIMISVFVAFMLSPETMVVMMGFALAVAVFFDAFIIRMIVVPAVISLLGARAWRLPSWLNKAIPNVDVEGSAVRNRGISASAEEPVDLPEPAART